MPAGPVWFTLPLGVLLVASFFAALRFPSTGDPLTAAAQTLAGFVLLVAGAVAWDTEAGVVTTDACLYAAAQMWILAFWTMRGKPGDEGGDDDGGGGGSPPPEPEPPWWPDFEARFRDYARDGGGPRRPPRAPVGV